MNGDFNGKFQRAIKLCYYAELFSIYAQKISILMNGFDLNSLESDKFLFLPPLYYKQVEYLWKFQLGIDGLINYS